MVIFTVSKAEYRINLLILDTSPAYLQQIYKIYENCLFFSNFYFDKAFATRDYINACIDYY